MKKIITLVFVILISTSNAIFAQQGTACNAAFNVVVNGYTARFNPLFVFDSSYQRHSWNFGDGSSVSNNFYPVHTYQANGVYLVMHTVSSISSNNTVCLDSAVMTITISSQPTPLCNISARFNFLRDSLLTFNFI